MSLAKMRRNVSPKKTHAIHTTVPYFRYLELLQHCQEKRQSISALACELIKEAWDRRKQDERDKHPILTEGRDN